MDDGNIQLIYIVGGGHSGSTLLDLLIGSSDEATSLGEFSFYSIYRDRIPHPKINSVTGYQCACGAELPACPFWTAVDALIPEKAAVHKRYSIGENLKMVLYAFLPGARKMPSWFSCNDDKLFRAIRTIAGTKYLVDSSKDPRRLVELFHNGKIDLRVLYVIRDGRAYGSSYSHDRRIRHGLKKRSYLVSVLEWVGLNLFIRRFLRKSRIPHIQIAYDVFCQSPEQHIQQINAALGTSISPDHYVERIKKTAYHNVNGNLRTLSKPRPIRYDQSWKERIPRWKVVLSSIVVVPLNALWLRSRFGEKEMK